MVWATVWTVEKDRAIDALSMDAERANSMLESRQNSQERGSIDALLPSATSPVQVLAKQIPYRSYHLAR